MREKVDDKLPAAQSRYKYENSKDVRETPVFKSNEVVSVDRPLFSMKTGSARNADRPADSKLFPRSDGPVQIISVHHHSLTLGRSVIANTISIAYATQAPLR